MNSYILRGHAKDYSVRIFAADTKSLVEKTRTTHGSSPVATAALGRTLTAGSMMGTMMKGEKDKLTITLRGKGPIGNVVVVGNSKGIVKGYVSNPQIDLPLRPDGKLDVGGAIGTDGEITVIKDLGMKEPYIGKYELVTGEVADDLTAYFAYSEQQPSAVALGVLIDTDCSVKAAGGFIVQIMPEANEDTISKLERNLNKIPSLSFMLGDGMTIEQIVEILMAEIPYEISDKIPVDFVCDCHRERIEQVLISLGKEELVRLRDEEDEKVEVVCHFCNEKYNFERHHLDEIIDSL